MYNQDNRRQFLQEFLTRSSLPASLPCIMHTGELHLMKKIESIPESSPGKNRKNPKPAAIDPSFQPAYQVLYRKGELKKRGEALWEILRSCRLCPRECGVNRLERKKGVCQSTAQLRVSAFHPHFGEERPLVGRGGSGTIFFSSCNLRCVFCINWEISQGGHGWGRSLEELAAMMLDLQQTGCHNINIVTPTHFSPHIVGALILAAEKGLRLPLVYNTNGWERQEILHLLDGIVDIYMPDFKFSDAAMAHKYCSGADDYPKVTQDALLEMHRQVGAAKPAADGLLYRGLLIRHLVMPNDTSGTRQVVEWIAGHLPKDTYVNIMSQYRPMYRAHEYPEIARRLSREEYRQAVQWARDAGLTRLDIQG